MYAHYILAKSDYKQFFFSDGFDPLKTMFSTYDVYGVMLILYSLKTFSIIKYTCKFKGTYTSTDIV